MSIPKLEPEPSAVWGSAGTDPIPQLARDILTQLAVPRGTETSVLEPETRRATVIPERALIPGVSAAAVPALVRDESAEPALAGGFPSASPTTHPPVHSVLQPVENRAPAPLASGEHIPDGSESYPFGEPRCNGSLEGIHPQPSVANQPGSSAPLRPPGEFGATNPRPKTVATLGDEATYYFLTPVGLDKQAGNVAEETQPVRSWSAVDVEAIRQDFPALHQRVNGKPLVWFDNAATTHKPRSVIDATSRFYARDNSNIHRAAHALAARSTELFEAGREKVRRFLGAADAREIVFVRGTTEAINLVAQSYGRKNIHPGDEILLTEMEHHANIVPWQLLAEQTGSVIRVAPINDRGELILEEFGRLIGPRTRIVALTHVSNALGTINPVREIVALAHAQGVPVLVDGAQSTPHFPVNVQELDADFYTFSGHKVFGPTGIGALYAKTVHLEAMPPWQGGGHMIREVRFEKTTYQNAPERFEAGTPDIAGVVGLGAAIDYLFQVGLPALAAYEHALLEYATTALATVPGLRPIGTARNKASVLSFVIPGRSTDSIARHLDREGIAVRAGHHCAQPAQRHFGVETTVRPSLAFYNTFAEVDALVDSLHKLPRR